MSRDEGNIFVLEGVLMGLILLGAAWAIGDLRASSIEDARPRTELERVASDALTVLGGLTDGSGTPLLDLYLAEALHCAEDPEPSQLDCDGRESENLSLKIQSYLPVGAGYAVAVGNGEGDREIYRAPLPMGEAVATSRSLGLSWNHTFVASEFSCYDPDANVTFVLIPIDRGNVTGVRWANVSVGAVESGGVPGHNGWWNASLPAVRAASGTAVANVTALASPRPTLHGVTTYGACDLAGHGTALRAARNLTTIDPSEKIVRAGTSVTFTAQLAALHALLDAKGGSLGDARVSVYSPAPPRHQEPDTWILEAEVPLAGAATRTGTWNVPVDALYGAHPALLRVEATLGATEFEVRVPVVVTVGLASGEVGGKPVVPKDPPYRVTLQTWLPDWG